MLSFPHHSHQDQCAVLPPSNASSLYPSLSTAATPSTVPIAAAVATAHPFPFATPTTTSLQTQQAELNDIPTSLPFHHIPSPSGPTDTDALRQYYIPSDAVTAASNLHTPSAPPLSLAPDDPTDPIKSWQSAKASDDSLINDIFDFQAIESSPYFLA